MFRWSLSPLCEVGTLIAEDSTECRGCSDPPKLGGPGRSGVELWAQDCPAPKARLPRAAGCRGVCCLGPGRGSDLRRIPGKVAGSGAVLGVCRDARGPVNSREEPRSPLNQSVYLQPFVLYFWGADSVGQGLWQPPELGPAT